MFPVLKMRMQAPSKADVSFMISWQKESPKIPTKLLETILRSLLFGSARDYASKIYKGVLLFNDWCKRCLFAVSCRDPLSTAMCAFLDVDAPVPVRFANNGPFNFFLVDSQAVFSGSFSKVTDIKLLKLHLAVLLLNGSKVGDSQRFHILTASFSKMPKHMSGPVRSHILEKFHGNLA